MSAPVTLLARTVRSFYRSQAFRAVPSHHAASIIKARNKQVLKTPCSSVHTQSTDSRISNLITITDEPDVLYKKIEVLAKGHDKTVLDSYEYFAVLAAKELGIHIEAVSEPQRKIERFTLLKSIHIFKKHRVQYEMRTHYRCFELTHLTGCTANVYLEYIQRNLPEGVALEITKTRLEKLPDHIKYPVWDQLLNQEDTKSP
ncbi:28S ribosomal protein S10, mitochondrial isoform X2 [Bombina bombina]|uniref:28S ribosomal protein S10, mitochondrial isoform X2 n=1 Tax=Bombina bombina TaxID=8345 RepID=UPI00235A6D3E|nr:28S ribosomal protein S10, mitochondrial isoform X2 [Bombina bombina]